MKKFILSFSTVFIFSGSFSQITILESDLPEAGYTYLVSADTLTSVIIGAPSASAQVWDYSTLLQHYLKFPTYDSTINTAFQTDFAASTLYTYGPEAMYSGFYGGAPIGSQGMNNGYMFWRRDNTGFWIVGFRSDDGIYANKNVLYNPQELMIKTPATYNDVINNTARWELFFGDNTANLDTLFVTNLKKTLTVDAFGDLTTPVGNYPDVLRIHEYLITVDSSYATILGNPLAQLELKRDTLNNYIFMDNLTNYPVCIVHADKNDNVLNVEYYKGYSMVNIAEISTNQISVYPNPSNGIFTLTVPTEVLKSNSTKLIIRDINGRVVETKSIQSEKNVIELNQVSGTYFLTIISAAEILFNGKILITN